MSPSQRNQEGGHKRLRMASCRQAYTGKIWSARENLEGQSGRPGCADRFAGLSANR